jgi:hypothetical protein
MAVLEEMASMEAAQRTEVLDRVIQQTWRDECVGHDADADPFRVGLEMLQLRALSVISIVSFLFFLRMGVACVFVSVLL